MRGAQGKTISEIAVASPAGGNAVGGDSDAAHGLRKQGKRRTPGWALGPANSWLGTAENFAGKTKKKKTCDLLKKKKCRAKTGFGIGGKKPKKKKKKKTCGGSSEPFAQGFFCPFGEFTTGGRVLPGAFRGPPKGGMREAQNKKPNLGRKRGAGIGVPGRGDGGGEKKITNQGFFENKKTKWGDTPPAGGPGTNLR